MAIVGIICEYDPFHLGHKRQFELIRRQLPDARIVCLMSGCFTQRGMPAVHMPAHRARAALLAGADAVMELPCAFAVRDAEHFALGGVDVLTRLGFVTHLSFGTESGIQLLQPAAVLLEHPTPTFTAALKKALEDGSSFAAAQGKALDECFPDAASPWSKPNNILALCYLRALIRLNSPLLPLPVLREGDYHAKDLGANQWPSASAVRQSFWTGDLPSASKACGWDLPVSPVCAPDALDTLLLYRLRTSSLEQLAQLPDCSEGLENRLQACAYQSTSRTALLEALKTKRYAYARLSRLCCHALLGVTQQWLDRHPTPEYVRLLGLKKESSDLTALFKGSRIRIIAKAADQVEMLSLDQTAYDLWALGAGLPAGLLFRQGVTVV